MANKGQSEFCCCTGCETPPTVWGDNGRDLQLGQIWQVNCCACVPKYACITILGKGTATLKLYCPPSPENIDQPLYKGTLFDGTSTVIDIAIHFRIVSGQCRLTFVSDALGSDGTEAGQYFVITSEARSTYHFCRTLASNPLGYTEFSFDGNTVQIKRANHTAVRGRHHCVDSYGNTVWDDNPIRNICCSCACLSKCMCLTVSGAGPGIAAAEIACLETLYIRRDDDDGATVIGWSFPSIGASVTFGASTRPFKYWKLLHCWPLDEASGTREDSWASASLSESGTVGRNMTGKIDQAASFTGAGYLYHPDEPGLRMEHNTTIALWLNIQPSCPDAVIVSKAGDFVADDMEYVLLYDTGTETLFFSASNGTDIATVTLPTPVNVGYTLVLITRDQTAQTISLTTVNGSGTIATDTEPLTGTLLITEHEFRIGARDFAAAPMRLTGLVDQVFMWQDVLTTFEIEGLWNLGAGRSCKQDPRCYLNLNLDSAAFDAATTAIPILIDPVSNPCPHPKARWEIVERATEEIPYSHSLFFEVSAVPCGESCEVNIPSCCENGRTQFPKVLYADVTTTCPACSTITVSMVWDTLLSQWIGRYSMCGHSAELRIGCGFKNLNFFGSPCFSVTATDPTASCGPILAVFNFSTGGIGCCGVSSLINPNISVTVYE